MELALYTAVVILAMAFSFRPTMVESNAKFKLFVLVGFGIFSMAVRIVEFDADIINYARRMKDSYLTLYYIREPVVWIGQRFVFWITNSSLLTFVVFDIVCFCLVLNAFRRLNMPQYAIIAFVAFFPFVLGMQNVYRQWVSSCLAIYALSLSDRNFVRAAFFFVLSVLSHNVAALFFPVIFSRGPAPLRMVLLMLGTLIVPIALVMGAGTKSDAATGMRLEHVYLVLVCLTLAATLSMRTLAWKSWTLAALAFSIYVVAWSTATLSSAGSERTALFVLMLLYPAIVMSIEENISYKTPARMALSALGFLPMILFEVRIFII